MSSEQNVYHVCQHTEIGIAITDYKGLREPFPP
jgi:hypothetical protein